MDPPPPAIPIAMDNALNEWSIDIRLGKLCSGPFCISLSLLIDKFGEILGDDEDDWKKIARGLLRVKI